jgi:hypothetical protein
MSEQLLKGPAAEEALRNYFLSIGYFVVRGCKFRFNRFDITDVDLWLYGRNSPLSRERVNVDIKNKKTPQALERIFWAKGLQNVLDLDGCIVATNDTRPDVREFGLKHQVKVLDGRFLGRLTKSVRSHQERITEEKFIAELEHASLGKLNGDWKGRYETSKTRLITSLTFDGCNAWLDDISYFMEQAGSSSLPDVSAAWRMVYVSSAYFLIAVDFILREHITAEHEQRRALLDSGFRYGTAGQAFTENVGRMAATLVGSFVTQPGLAKTVEHELREQAASVKAELLAEFFSKTVTQSALFDTAKELEVAAFAHTVAPPSAMSPIVQSMLAVLADFFSLDRKRILV